MVPVAYPIRKEKLEGWKGFVRELTGERNEEFRDANRRHGVTAHRAWLETLPDGSGVALVEVEGPGAGSYLESMAASDHPFDGWFLDRISDFHGIDFRSLRGIQREAFLDAAPS